MKYFNLSFLNVVAYGCIISASWPAVGYAQHRVRPPSLDRESLVRKVRPPEADRPIVTPQMFEQAEINENFSEAINLEDLGRYTNGLTLKYDEKNHRYNFTGALPKCIADLFHIEFENYDSNKKAHPVRIWKSEYVNSSLQAACLQMTPPSSCRNNPRTGKLNENCVNINSRISSKAGTLNIGYDGVVYQTALDDGDLVIRYDSGIPGEDIRDYYVHKDGRSTKSTATADTIKIISPETKQRTELLARAKEIKDQFLELCSDVVKNKTQDSLDSLTSFIEGKSDLFKNMDNLFVYLKKLVHDKDLEDLKEGVANATTLDALNDMVAKISDYIDSHEDLKGKEHAAEKEAIVALLEDVIDRTGMRGEESKNPILETDKPTVKMFTVAQAALTQLTKLDGNSAQNKLTGIEIARRTAEWSAETNNIQFLKDGFYASIIRKKFYSGYKQLGSLARTMRRSGDPLLNARLIKEAQSYQALASRRENGFSPTGYSDGLGELAVTGYQRTVAEEMSAWNGGMDFFSGGNQGGNQFSTSMPQQNQWMSPVSMLNNGSQNNFQNQNFQNQNFQNQNFQNVNAQQNAMLLNQRMNFPQQQQQQFVPQQNGQTGIGVY